MKEYDVKITETLEKTVTVQAESHDAAEEQVRAAYYNSEYILDSENFTGVEFGTTEEREVQKEQAAVSYTHLLNCCFKVFKRLKVWGPAGCAFNVGEICLSCCSPPFVSTMFIGYAAINSSQVEGYGKSKSVSKTGSVRDPVI